MNEPIFEKGTVWLVGAGPGDPGLLTLHAVNALKQADVIVYDALVSHEVLDYAAPMAQREFAGKRGGRPSAAQRDITLRLIELARQGHRVLRLKGGDPFIFGRGAEEAKGLADAGIRFHIIPGITAGIAGLVHAGIPATARETNHAVIFITGHAAADATEGINWTALTATGQPLVIYMGLMHLSQIRAGLLGGGCAAETPVAVIANATLPSQAILETTVETMADDVERNSITSPAIIVIGSIVGLRHALLPYQIR